MSKNHKKMPEPLPSDWDKSFQETADFVQRHIVPMYLLGEGELKLERTGVLFQIAGYKFIITAAHNLRDYDPKEIIPCFAHAKETQFPIPFSEATFYYTESNEIRSVRDIAAIKLTESQIENIPDYWQFLSMPQVGHDSEIDDSFYFVMGFPSHQEWYAQENWRDPKPLPYATRITNPESSKIFDPKVHLALSFNRQAVPLASKDGSSHPITLPRIQGMSGCGIWKVFPAGIAPNNWNIRHVRLVGIQNRCKHDEYILGTQIRWVLHRLVDDFPEIKNALQISYRSGY